MHHDPLKPYEVPDRWTAAHVMVRMVQAFETLSRIKGREGPRGYGSGWPQYVHEWEDLLAQEETEAAERRRRKYQERDVVLPPDSRSVTLMEEAFLWPVRYLGGDRAKNVAIVRWAMKRARNIDDERRAIAQIEAEAQRIANGLILARVVVR